MSDDEEERDQGTGSLRWAPCLKFPTDACLFSGLHSCPGLLSRCSGCLSSGQLCGQIKEWTNMEIASGMLSKTLLQNGEVKVLLWKRSLVHSKESRYSQWSELCRSEPALALPLRTLWFRRSGLYYRETKVGILMVSKAKNHYPFFL